MVIDTHCHLEKEQYENLEEIIEKMKDHYMISSACSKETFQELIDLIKDYPNIYGTIGFHPEEADKYQKEDLLLLEKYLENKKIVGIGEIGLDYHYEGINKEKQKELFLSQLDLALKYKKAVVIHSRDAALDTYNLLKPYAFKIPIVLHCYSYSKEMAEKFIELGCKLGIGGVLTFKNEKKLKEIVKEFSLENFLLETDSPYLSPEPKRGIKNEPSHIFYVAQKMAELKGLKEEEVLNQTTSNAIAQFDLPIWVC